MMNQSRNVTGEVKDFYNKTPFPNYDDIDTADRLIEKAGQGWFAKSLDEQIPLAAKILECGCGTGQLSNFLSIKKREIIAADLSMNALKLGKQFADKNKLDSVQFINMDLLNPPFAQQSFDLVISNGVLHHTADTKAAFLSIAKLVKTDGYLVIGLYHYWGRLITDFRRLLFQAFGTNLSFLDPNLRGRTLTPKQQSWYNDQYLHPCERKHTIREVVEWYEEAGFSVARSIPDTHLLAGFSPQGLFSKKPMAGPMESTIKEISQVFHGSKEGGFFIVIGRKK